MMIAIGFSGCGIKYMTLTTNNNFPYPFNNKAYGIKEFEIMTAGNLVREYPRRKNLQEDAFWIAPTDTIWNKTLIRRIQREITRYSASKMRINKEYKLLFIPNRIVENPEKFKKKIWNYGNFNPSYIKLQNNVFVCPQDIQVGLDQLYDTFIDCKGRECYSRLMNVNARMVIHRRTPAFNDTMYSGLGGVRFTSYLYWNKKDKEIKGCKYFYYKHCFRRIKEDFYIHRIQYMFEDFALAEKTGRYIAW